MEAIFSFGIISDIQFCDANDGSDYFGIHIRRYRQSLDILRAAVCSFQQEQTVCNIQLGDVLDGKAGLLQIQHKCLDEVFNITHANGNRHQWHYLIGNHELYCFNRNELYDKFIQPIHQPVCAPDKLYYDFNPQAGFRFILLDCFDVSTIGPSSEANGVLAAALLETNNPNLASGSGWSLPSSSYLSFYLHFLPP